MISGTVRLIEVYVMNIGKVRLFHVIRGYLYPCKVQCVCKHLLLRKLIVNELLFSVKLLDMILPNLSFILLHE